ncbi:DUF998 domain-containing protein [Aeromicrobium phragmitis]|uniref:DUF998 domain-containing protein n=1 Tax=Aeromicrobium phragmitis TaxID=2478914 RepID=A0A3L8PPT1_9ACTN|nr:DUF998 domain-containing protein [Aeromicrobium phragmitis]RLV57194.1 DUF998 domain-containing protein [Aeromicrobium phragmitis]
MGLTMLGAAASVGFLLVFTLDGWTRPGFSARRHPVSALALGPRGWLQTANFIVCGVASVIAAFGLRTVSDWTALAVAAAGLALIASGIWRMDPMRGYPPGAPAHVPLSETSTSHRIHDVAGMGVFGALPIAALLTALADVDPWLRWYSVVTAVVTAILLGVFGTAWERDTPNAGAWQRLLIVAGWSWLTVLFVVAA